MRIAWRSAPIGRNARRTRPCESAGSARVSTLAEGDTARDRCLKHPGPGGPSAAPPISLGHLRHQRVCVTICGTNAPSTTGPRRAAMGRTARVRATGELGLGAPFAGSPANGGKGAGVSPFERNVRTRRSRSGAAQSCERSVDCEARRLRLCRSAARRSPPRAMGRKYREHRAAVFNEASENWIPIFVANTSFAALNGPRARPAGPDVAIEGSFRPLPPFAGRPANRAPTPISAVALTRAVRPIASDGAPVCSGRREPRIAG